MILYAFAALAFVSQIQNLPNIPELREWIKTYGSPSPLIAINKTSSDTFKISDEHIQQILSGKTKVTYTKPLTIMGKNVLEYDIFEEDDARRFEVLADYDAGDERVASNSLVFDQSQRRFGFMLAEFYKLLANRKDDELLIVLVGRMHAFDIYFNFFLQDADKIKRNPALQRRREIVYVNYPLNDQMKFYSENYYELWKALDGVETPIKTVASISGGLATSYLARLHYFNDLKKDTITLSSLKDETLSRFGAIVFMDLHFLDSPSPFKSMPTADALRRAGFKTVKFAVESWKAGKEYTLEDFNRLYRTPQAFSIRDYELQFLSRKNPKMKKRYLEGDLVIDPNFAFLHEKLKSYKRGGLSVLLTGMEEKESFTEGVVDTTTSP